MPDYIAVKLLAERSDLGWFKGIFERRQLPDRLEQGFPGKQKGITLAGEIFEQFYPSAQDRKAAYQHLKRRRKEVQAGAIHDPQELKRLRQAEREAGTIAVDVRIFGPGLRPAIECPSRAIVLQDKNWRLNGKFIDDPPGDPHRYEPTLQEGDIALIGFHGVGEPTSATVLLLSANIASDIPLRAQLAEGLVKRLSPMKSITRHSLEAILMGLELPGTHPAWAFTADPAADRDLEEAAKGDAQAIQRVGVRRAGRPMTAAELQDWRQRGERNGQWGEALVDLEFRRQTPFGSPPIHRWVSLSVAANHPCDFERIDAYGQAWSEVDVKTTSGGWDTPFYVSIGELAHAARSQIEYLIFRVSEAGENGGWLRMSNDFRPLAREILAKADELRISGAIAMNFQIWPQAVAGLWRSESPIRLLPPGAAHNPPEQEDLEDSDDDDL